MLNDRLEFGEKACEDLFGAKALVYSVSTDFEVEGFVLELGGAWAIIQFQLHMLTLVPETEIASGGYHSILKVGFQLNAPKFSYFTFTLSVAHYRWGFSKIGLVGDHVDGASLHGSYFGTECAHIDAHHSWSSLVTYFHYCLFI